MGGEMLQLLRKLEQEKLILLQDTGFPNWPERIGVAHMNEATFYFRLADWRDVAATLATVRCGDGFRRLVTQKENVTKNVVNFFPAYWIPDTQEEQLVAIKDL